MPLSGPINRDHTVFHTASGFELQANSEENHKGHNHNLNQKKLCESSNPPDPKLIVSLRCGRRSKSLNEKDLFWCIQSFILSFSVLC